MGALQVPISAAKKWRARNHQKGREEIDALE
jgi:hypothetical protein